MLYSSLDEGIVDRLEIYLSERIVSDPPQGCRVQTMRGGNVQDDPATKPGGFITIHIGDPDDPSLGHDVAGFGRSRFDVDGSQAAMFGRSRELGGGADWIYRYTVKIDYYFTKTGETRPQARAKATALNRWIARQLENLAPDPLGVYKVGDEVFTEMHVTNIYQNEGGGPPSSFIWTSKVRVEALVYVG
jgi:hypothetical protein